MQTTSTNSTSSTASSSGLSQKIVQLPPQASNSIDETLIVSRLLGDGGQAKVYEATSPSRPEIGSLAVKVFDKFSIANANGAPLREYNLLRKLDDNVNIVNAYNFKPYTSDLQLPTKTAKTMCSDNAGYMSMELCENGDLFDLISKRGAIPDTDLLKHLFLQVCNAVNGLNETANMSHLDLKLDNILIGNDLRPKLCDFGFACDNSKPITRTFGTLGYMAPEVLNKPMQGSYCASQADIYSLGVILFIFNFGIPPYNEARESERLFALFNKKKEYLFKMHPRTRESYKNNSLDGQLVSLIYKMLSGDLTVRPRCIDEVINDPYFTASDQISDEESATRLQELLAATE